MALDSNLWQQSAVETYAAPPLNEDMTADLAIIGGGFTGNSAALHGAEAGADVVVLEAETIGHGGSGRNVGLVNAGLWLPPDDVERELGAEQGGRLNRALAAGPDLVFSLIEQHAIECEATRTGTLHCAHAPSGQRDLENRYSQQVKRGAPVELLDVATARERTGTDQVHGALFDARAGTINPLAYCRGLARAAAAAGARHFEQTPVTAIMFNEGSWQVVTPRGRVRAAKLLMATNGYHVPIDGIAEPQVVPVHYFQLATKPLSDNLARSVLPGREGCWDTHPVMSSFRMDQAGRLLVGAVGALDHAGHGIHRAWANRKLAKLFPSLAGQPIEHAWFGRIAMTADHIPKILTIGDDGLAIFGYSGRGISPGTTFGRAAAAALLSRDRSELPLDVIDSYAERFTGLKRGYYELGATLTHLVGR